MALQQPKKRRRAMTEADRRAVRRWEQANPKATHEDVIKWFDQEYHHKISQQIVSTTLSTKYDYLDSDMRNDRQLTAARTSKPEWPALEFVLFEWQQRLQKHKAIMTGDLLKSKVHEIWH
jgi:hypothetical protein